MEDYNCVWVDIVWKNQNVQDYMINSDIIDDICYRNVKSSLLRLIKSNDCAVVFYKNGDVAVVNVEEFEYNNGLRKALFEFQNHMINILGNLSNPKTIEILEKRMLNVVNHFFNKFNL